MGYDDDERAVVIDGDDEAAFARDYHPDHEEGWCLYGSINESHVRVDDVGPRGLPISTSADRIGVHLRGRDRGPGARRREPAPDRDGPQPPVEGQGVG